MDQAAYSEGLRRLIVFFEVEGLIGQFARDAATSRFMARRMIEDCERFGPAELVWFDLRWPEESGDAP